jgi:hypothetical protein
MTRAQDIYERQQYAFRLNLEFGLILRHNEIGEYRYFKPFSNDTLFQRPKKRTLTGSDDWSFAWNVRSRHPSSRNLVGSFFPSHHDPLTIFRENVTVVLHQGGTLRHHRGIHARTREKVWSVLKTQTITGRRDESQATINRHTSVKMASRTRTRSDQNLTSDRIYTSTMFSRIRRSSVRGQTPERHRSK